MAFTDELRTQHRELSGMIEQLDQMLEASALSANADAAMELVTGLSQKLKSHLKMESLSLLPALVKVGDKDVKMASKKFVVDAGGISKILAGYTKHWPNSEAIRTNPRAFIGESRQLIRELSSRVQRAESELYSVADKVLA